MYQISFYVPDKEAEKVKNAMFEAGAGHVGNYDHCSWQTSGTGQFRPLEGSNPAIGSHGEVETVTELRVEMVCLEKYMPAAIAAMKRAHSYEEVAYLLVKLANEEI